MNRLVCSAIGLILTFIFIIYTAPDKQPASGSPGGDPIKTINESTPGPVNKIRRPVYKNRRGDLFSTTSTKVLAAVNK